MLARAAKRARALSGLQLTAARALASAQTTATLFPGAQLGQCWLPCRALGRPEISVLPCRRRHRP